MSEDLYRLFNSGKNKEELFDALKEYLRNESINTRAKYLTDLFFDAKNYSSFKLNIDECKALEEKICDQFQVFYLPKLKEANIQFLTRQYFEDYTYFEQHQKIPKKYFTQNCNFYFISHRWLTPNHPDPNQEQFLSVKDYILKIESDPRFELGFWYDYSCIPQKTNNKNLTKVEQLEFDKALRVMHLLPLLSNTILLYDNHYLSRSWCLMEWLCATYLSPIKMGESQTVPFNNAVKFRHIAILVLFLVSSIEFKKLLAQGDDDEIYIMILTTLVRNLILSGESSIEDDKYLLVTMAFEHLYYHVQAFGLRTQLMYAFQSLSRFDRDTIENIFHHFLSITGDLDCKWATECSIIETGLYESKLSQMVFFRQKPIIISNSKIESK